ncbi:MAG: shikimate dehydrogenase [Legionellaceae bacterium]|nr:shikimate dehydrogenase [Legionellaceae bacterium]
MLAQYAVMGNPVEQSLSPGLHQQFAKEAGIALEYTRILMDETMFERQVQAFFDQGGAGLNITAPGKARAFNLATIKTERCVRAGAANTLWVNEKGQLCADNTDGVGLIRDLKRRVKLVGARILVLGAGGAVYGIMPNLLAEMPRAIAICNRTKARAEALVRHIGCDLVTCVQLDGIIDKYDIVIHATGRALSGLACFKGTPFCYDLTYDESGVTPFVQWARMRGYPAVDGFGMLVEQAAEAFSVWHGASLIKERL